VPLVLGIGASTSGCSIEIRDSDDGRLYASGRGEVAKHANTVDPADWWHALVDARRSVGGALPVAAVGAAAPTDALIVVDDEGRPLCPARLGSDPDAAADAADLRERLGVEAWMSACGRVPTDATNVAKLASLRRRDAAMFARISRVLTPHDWLTFRLSRRYVTDRGDASTTGYWSQRENRWRADLLALIDRDVDWGALLPRQLAPTEPAGDREGVSIAPGTGEPMAVALGLGMQPGDVTVWLDAPAGVFALRERPTEDERGLVAGLADASGRFLPYVGELAATSVTDGLARVLDLDVAELDQLALAAPPGAVGVMFVPPRTVGQRVQRGAILDLDADTTIEHVARAAIESIVCTLLDAIDSLRAADVPVAGRLCLAGGGARSHAFQRVFADLAGRPVHVPASGSMSALGACMQAAAVVHNQPIDALVEAWGVRKLRAVEPDGRVDGDAIRDRYARLRR